MVNSQTPFKGPIMSFTFISRPQHDWLLDNYPLFFRDVMKNTGVKRWCLAGVTIDKNPEIEALFRGYVAPKKETFKFVV